MQLTIPAAPSPATVVPNVHLLHGDCLELLPEIPESSINLIFADVPYSTALRKVTINKWDTPVDLTVLRDQWLRVRLNNGCLVMTAVQPFGSYLINTLLPYFKYELVYEKNNASGFLQANRSPLRAHENILIFCKGKSVYNPQMTLAEKAWSGGKNGTKASNWLGFTRQAKQGGLQRYPRSVLRPKFEAHNKRVHPTQKPIALLEWLILTYTNEGDTVLDPVSGSATTAIAALRTGRNAICIERDATYFEVGRQRVAAEQARLGHPVTV